MIWSILKWISLAVAVVFMVLYIVFYAKDNATAFRKSGLGIVISLMAYLLFFAISKVVLL